MLGNLGRSLGIGRTLFRQHFENVGGVRLLHEGHDLDDGLVFQLAEDVGGAVGDMAA